MKNYKNNYKKRRKYEKKKKMLMRKNNKQRTSHTFATGMLRLVVVRDEGKREPEGDGHRRYDEDE